MRALAYTRYGGPETMSILDLPKPAPAADELLIRVAAAGLNPVDALQREGTFKAITPIASFPAIAGNELSGTIESLGAEVTGFELGQQVIVRVGKNDMGADAEYAVVKAAYAAPAPASISLEDAAGLPLAGLTAQQGLGRDYLNIQRGERLLITGAAGGVGQLAVQLAALAGAEITVTASPEGEQTLRELGAAHVINYRETKVSEAKDAEGNPVRFDKVFDMVGGEGLEDLLSAVEPGGHVLSIAGPPTRGSLVSQASGARKAVAALAELSLSKSIRKAAKAAQVRYEFFLMDPDGQGLAELARLIDAGQLKLTIDSRFTLDQYKEAFARLESRRAKGKVILQIG